MYEDACSSGGPSDTAEDDGDDGALEAGVAAADANSPRPPPVACEAGVTRSNDTAYVESVMLLDRELVETCRGGGGGGPDDAEAGVFVVGVGDACVMTGVGLPMNGVVRASSMCRGRAKELRGAAADAGGRGGGGRAPGGAADDIAMRRQARQRNDSLATTEETGRERTSTTHESVCARATPAALGRGHCYPL